MNRLAGLINTINEVRGELTLLKIWLDRKEVNSYHTWRAENEKDRTAMDKVIAMLKMDDTEWKETELEYQELKNKYAYLKDIYNAALLYEGEDREVFVANFKI